MLSTSRNYSRVWRQKIHMRVNKSRTRRIQKQTNHRWNEIKILLRAAQQSVDRRIVFDISIVFTSQSGRPVVLYEYIFLYAHIFYRWAGGCRLSDGINACLRADWIFHFVWAASRFIHTDENSESAQKRCFRMEIDGARKSYHTLGVHLYGVWFKFWNIGGTARRELECNFSSNMHGGGYRIHSWINHSLFLDWFRANISCRLSI